MRLEQEKISYLVFQTYITNIDLVVLLRFLTALPMLHVQYGGTPALSAATAPSSNMTAFNFPNPTSNGGAGSPTYAFLNGPNQVK